MNLSDNEELEEEYYMYDSEKVEDKEVYVHDEEEVEEEEAYVYDH